MKNILRIIGTFVGIFLLIGGLLTYLAWYSDYQTCIENSLEKTPECLLVWITKAPSIQDAEKLADSCVESDTKCLTEITKMKIEDELTQN